MNPLEPRYLLSRTHSLEPAQSAAAFLIFWYIRGSNSASQGEPSQMDCRIVLTNILNILQTKRFPSGGMSPDQIRFK